MRLCEKIFSPDGWQWEQKGFSSLRATLLDGRWIPVTFTACLRTLLLNLPDFILHQQLFSLLLDHSSHRSSILCPISQLKLTNKLLLLHHVSWKENPLKELSELFVSISHSIFLNSFQSGFPFLPLQQNLISQGHSVIHVPKPNGQPFLSLPLTWLLANLTQLITLCFLKVSGHLPSWFSSPNYMRFSVNLFTCSFSCTWPGNTRMP